MNRSPSSTFGVLCALGAALAFSSLSIWGKLAQEAGLPTASLLAWRFGLVTLVLFVSGRARGPYRLQERAVMLGNGLLYFATTGTCFFALTRISAGTTVLLLYLAPAFVVLLQWSLGRRPHPLQLGAIVLAAVGLLLVAGLPAPRDRDALGLGVGVLSGAIYACYLVVSERHGHYPPLVATAHLSLSSAVGFACVGLLSNALVVPSTPWSWTLIGAISTFPTLLAVPLLFVAVHKLGAARASILVATEPVWAIVLAFFVLGEPLRVNKLLGGAFILAAAILSQWVPSADERKGSEDTLPPAPPPV